MIEDPNKKRRATAIRFFTYGLMTLATIIGVAICIAWAMGYRFNLSTGQVSQVALLQFNSFPTGATVDINGDRLTARTPTRSNIKTGETKVTMTRQGYRPWTKTVSALPSSVRWLDYARLVPQNIETESVKSFASVSQMTASPDKKWLVIQNDKKTKGLVLADISDPTKIKFSEIKYSQEALSDASEDTSEFRVVEWDSGSRYLLVEHKYGDQTEYIELDRSNPAETKNLTRDFGMNLLDPHFSGTSGNVFFTLTGTDLRKLDYGNKSVSAPIASDVTSYRLYSNGKIALVSTPKKNDKTVQQVSIYDDGKVELAREYKDVKPTIAEYYEHNDTEYIAIGREETIAIYTDPLKTAKLVNEPKQDSDEVAYLSSPGGIDWMEFSPSGRFVMAGYDKKVVSYDVETSENYSFETEQPITDPTWLDGYHILDVSNGNITMVEFDGANREHIVSGRIPATLSNDSKYLLSLDNISGGVILQRSKMTTD